MEQLKIYSYRGDPMEIIPCDFCKCEVPTRPFQWGPLQWGQTYRETRELPKRHLCDFCSSSDTGSMNIDKREVYASDLYKISKIIAQAVNHMKYNTGE